MAEIQKGPDGNNIINVGEKVGVNGVNAAGDVLAVQGLLKYLTQSQKKWTSVRLPEPYGVLDRATQIAIFDYQEHVRMDPTQSARFWIAKDGSVSPFKKGIRLLHKQELTITVLNNDCALLSAALHDDANHVEAIARRWPLTVGVALGRFNPHFL